MAICARVTAWSGQYCLVAQPAVTLSSARRLVYGAHLEFPPVAGHFYKERV